MGCEEDFHCNDHDFSVRFSLACLTESRSTGYGLKDLGPLHELHIKVTCGR